MPSTQVVPIEQIALSSLSQEIMIKRLASVFLKTESYSVYHRYRNRGKSGVAMNVIRPFLAKWVARGRRKGLDVLLDAEIARQHVIREKRESLRGSNPDRLATKAVRFGPNASFTSEMQRDQERRKYFQRFVAPQDRHNSGDMIPAAGLLCYAQSPGYYGGDGDFAFTFTWYRWPTIITRMAPTEGAKSLAAIRPRLQDIAIDTIFSMAQKMNDWLALHGQPRRSVV